MANNIQQHALDLYPSAKDVPYPPATHLSALENGDLTLEDMMRKLDFAGGPVVREGDVLRVSGRILDLNGQFVHITKDVTISNISNNQQMTLSIPPGINQTSQRNRGIADIVLPNPPQFTARISSPKAIWDAISSHAVLPDFVQLPAGDGDPTKKESQWDSITVVRGTSKLGTLNDIRLALQFLMNEVDLQSQLSFCRKRKRRTPNAATKAGFYMSDSNGFYLKVKTTNFGTLNQDLIINLGSDYNQELSSLAENGFIICMVDQRVLNTDGMPVSLLSKFETVLQHGPESFPSNFMRQLAGSAGWTNGYAHMGLVSLSRNQQGEVELGEGPFKYIYRTPGKAQLQPPADAVVTWTKQEEKKVDKFHAKLQGNIRHYPIPLSLSGPRFGIIATQYKKVGDEWVVDSNVHGVGTEVLKVPVDAFEVAHSKERTRKLSRRTRGYGVKVSDNGADGRHSITTLTGYEDAGRRGVKRSYREMVGEDE